MPYNYLTNSLVPSPTGGGVIPSNGGVGGFLGTLLGGLAGGLAGTALNNPLTGQPLNFGVPFVDIAPSGGAAIFEPYRQSVGGYTAQNFIAPDPQSGALKWFGPLGKPLLWSRDLQAVRRVGKLAGRARRSMGRSRLGGR